MEEPTKNTDRVEKPIIVFGAGPAGLGAAYYLSKAGRRVIVLEKEPRVGGMGASQKIKDCIADYGPHTFHLKHTVITKLFEQLSGQDLNEVSRNAKIWLNGKTLPFPMRIRDALFRLGPITSSRIIIDYVYQASLRRFFNNANKLDSFESWGISKFGHSLYRLAFGDYSEKMWGLPGEQLSVKLARQKLIGFNLWNLILSTLGLLGRKKSEAMGLSKKTLYDAYPKYGIGTFFDSLAEEIKKLGGAIELSSKITKINTEGEQISEVVYETNGAVKTIQCQALVSSIPLPALCFLLPIDYFGTVQGAASRIHYRSLIVVNLLLDQDSFSNAHWFYLLDPRLMSNRLSEQKNLSKEACPPGRTLVTLDITCNKDDYLWKSDDGFLIGLAMHDLSIMGLHPRTVLDAFVLKAADTYPVYSLGFEKNIEIILDRFKECPNLFSIGRHGLFLNNDMHDSIEMGFLAGQVLVEDKPSSHWYKIAAKYISERLEGIVRDPIQFKEK